MSYHEWICQSVFDFRNGSLVSDLYSQAADCTNRLKVTTECFFTWRQKHKGRLTSLILQQSLQTLALPQEKFTQIPEKKGINTNFMFKK